MQQARRDAGLDISDRIRLTVAAEPAVWDAVVTHQQFLMSETLAVQFGNAELFGIAPLHQSFSGALNAHPPQVAADRLGVRVQEQLGRIAPVPLIGLVGPVDPVAVALTRFDGGQEAVPDEAVHFVERHPGFGAVGVEEA